MTADTNNNIPNIPESWLALLGGRDVSGWLAAFISSSKKAVADLLWDAFYFGPLNLTERGQLLAGWLDRLGNNEHFAERLDAELTGWIEENWGRFDYSGESLASAWSCLCSVVEFSSKLHEDSRLKNCAVALRARFGERQRFLGSFSTAPAADPLGLYLAAVAEFQGEDRSLVAFWHRMCDLPDGVPFYHARYAMLGLRRLKAADSFENGTLRAEVVLGLLRLARAFDRQVREHGLSERVAKATFCRVAAQTAAAYPNSPRWREHGLMGVLELPNRSQRWLLKAVPPLAEAVRSESNKKERRQSQPTRSIEPDPSWYQRASELAACLRRGDQRCLPDVKHLLDNQKRYAEATGDTYYLVRSLRNLATRALPFSSKLALRWAEEAYALEPDDAFSLSTLKNIFLMQRNIVSALRFAWVAWKRFPEDIFARNGLAGVLRAASRYDEAERVYRETIERFPENVFARTGLAEVLRAASRYDEAGRVYRETIERFPKNVVARTGRAEVLKAAHRYDEAERVYRETIERFPENVFACNGLAGVLRAASRYDEAERVYRETIERFPKDIFTRIGLAYLVLRKGEAGRAEALDLINQSLKLDPLHHYALELKQKLASESQAHLDDLVNKWEETADALFEVPTSMASEEEEWDGEQEEIRLTENEQSLSFDQQIASREAKPVANYISEIESQHFTPSESLEVAALIAEAYFYRMWARDDKGKTSLERRQKAAELLDQAEQLASQDPQVLTERAALTVDEGDESVAYQKLTIQLVSHSSAVPLLVLKARLDRKRAQKESRQLDNASLAELCAIPQRLRDLNLTLTPLYYFQKGLAALALLDGAKRKQTAADEFSKFRQTIARRASAEKKERKTFRNRKSREVPQFHEWLKTQVDARIFAKLTQSEDIHIREDDIVIIENTWKQHPYAFEEVEDLLADRLTFRTI